MRVYGVLGIRIKAWLVGYEGVGYELFEKAQAE
jgi:hypothetical protein